MIASTTVMSVPGAINASGAGSGYVYANYRCGGGGSGGAIHLISTTLNQSSNPGNPAIQASAGNPGCANGAASSGASTPGTIRVEACTFQAAPPAGAITSTPTRLFLPTAPIPAILITSVNGIVFNANPITFPDIQISTASAVPVVITAHQVPPNTVPTLFIYSDNSEQQYTCPAGLQGTVDSSTCTINVPFPFGGSRGFVKVTWTQ